VDLLFVRCSMSNFLLRAWFLVVPRKATFLGKLGTLGTAGSLNLTKLKNPLACELFDTMISLILTYNNDEHITGVYLPNQICRYTRDTWCSRYTRYSRYKVHVWHPLYFIPQGIQYLFWWHWHWRCAPSVTNWGKGSKKLLSCRKLWNWVSLWCGKY